MNSNPRRTHAALPWVLPFLLGLTLAAAGADDAPPVLRYNRDIRPILSENCFQCHGPDKAQRKGKLRLDLREDALTKQALVPGRPEESEMLKRLASVDPEEVMPPPSTHKTVTPAQRELLRRWITDGAAYEAHWAYLPVSRPAVPAGSADRNPIDAFVQDRLKREGLEPAPEAERATLLRRLSFDLTGLPPTPAELAAFLKDRSKLAYERQVERLLASPHFGERMAVPWLDVVRFTDTVGYHGDQNQRIFPYRDYVIAAFNANKPFDAFTTEQLAGDLLPNPTAGQRVATGCNRLNMMTREGGAQPKEYLAKYQADRVRTVSTAWLGSTMACCECHDHKYDPFTTRDFYSMSAYFADIRQWGVYQDYNYTPNPDLRGWSNDHPFPPEIEVESPYLQTRIARLNTQIRAIAGDAAHAARTNRSVRAAVESWKSDAAAFLSRHPGGWEALDPASKSTPATNAPVFETTDGGILRFSKDDLSTDRLEFTLPAGGLAALRLELLPDPARSNRIIRGTRDSMTLEVSAAVRRASGTEDKLGFRYADANRRDERYSDGHELLGVRDGWATSKQDRTSTHDSVWLLQQPVTAATGDVLVLTLKNNAAARLRVSASPLSLEPEPGDPTAAYARLKARLPRGDSLGVLQLRSTGFDTNAVARIASLEREIHECRGGRAWTMVTGSTNAITTRVLPRGNWMDESGAVVSPEPPAFLRASSRQPPASAAAEPASSTRLDLARWLVSPDNPLTARNFANRLWAQFFGAGISARIEDLGAQGDWPTHPELLDWLAAEFMNPAFAPSRVRGVPPPQSWDVKHLIRTIVLSSTYRQSSEPSARAREVDPANKLLARQSPRRLEAEFVRDNALAAAGLLNLDVGGPSAFPYQPAGYYANLQFPDRDYRANRDDRQYRRGLYMHWQRTFLHPMLANFDAQSREECVAARLVSNTPQQALTLLNDPTFTEASRVCAEVAMRATRSDDARLDRIFRGVLGRSPRPAERASLTAFLAAQRAHYGGDPEEASRIIAVGNAPVAKDLPAAELAAWSNVARVVLNLHETITRY